MSAKNSLQNPFLAEICKEKVPVSVFLVNGIKLHGVIEDFDDDVVMLNNTITQMIYKNAISTVVPARLVRVSGSNSEE